MLKTVDAISTGIMERLRKMDDSEKKIERFCQDIKDSRIKLLIDLKNEDDKLRIRDELAKLRGMLDVATPEEFKDIVATAAALI